MGIIFENWIVLALLCSFFESLKNLWSKKALGKGSSALGVAFATRFISGIVLLPIVLPQLLTKIGQISGNWWLSLFLGAGLNAFNVFLFMRALSKGALSHTEPIMNFTPFFLLLTAPFFLAEYPTKWGVLGMMFILVGAWILNYKATSSLWQPFWDLLRSPGPRLMLLVAFLASLTTLFDKRGTLSTSPLIWTCAVNLTISFFYLLALLLFPRSQFPLRFNKWLIGAGLANGISTFFQMAALNLTLTAYVISIKRTSAIFSVLFGYYFLKEFFTFNQFIGVLIMVGGVLIITFMRQ